MKLGYPCINLSLDCKSNSTFRLKSYSEGRLIKTVENNLFCLEKILDFNIKNNLLFFRITSELVPFASHDICNFDWQDHFKSDFEKIGKIISNNNIRISMHPDQFIVLNSKNKKIVENSIKELVYHADVLDLMKLYESAKIQLHIGGAYGEKQKSLDRFIKVYNSLDSKIIKRLVIENDHTVFSLKDCLYVNSETNIPILFDVYHHSILNNGEDLVQCFNNTIKTWNKKDGILLIDYSSQLPNESKGRHANKIDIKNFKKFINETKEFDFDIMLEIKDKEKSALKAIQVLKNDERLIH